MGCGFGAGLCERRDEQRQTCTNSPFENRRLRRPLGPRARTHAMAQDRNVRSNERIVAQSGERSPRLLAYAAHIVSLRPGQLPKRVCTENLEHLECGMQPLSRDARLGKLGYPFFPDPTRFALDRVRLERFSPL